MGSLDGIVRLRFGDAVLAETHLAALGATGVTGLE